MMRVTRVTRMTRMMRTTAKLYTPDATQTTRP
jgi:hypothetical protein